MGDLLVTIERKHITLKSSNPVRVASWLIEDPTLEFSISLIDSNGDITSTGYGKGVEEFFEVIDTLKLSCLEEMTSKN